MTSIDTLPTQSSSAERERKVVSHIEALRRGEENPPLSLSEAKALEVKGDFSRIATFEIGSNVNDEGVAVPEIDSNNPHAVVLDIWIKGDKVFALPRSAEVDETETIADKAWDLTDLPKGLVVGRERDDTWEKKTGKNLPPEVSGRHFGIVLRDGELFFADVGSSNGTRMETAVLDEEEVSEDSGEREADADMFPSVSGSLVEPSDSIYARLNTEPPAIDETPLSAESAPIKDESEKKGYDLEAMDRQLQGMQIAANNWETTLGLEPAKTFPAHLSGVAATLAGDIRALHDLRTEMDPEVNSPADLKLTEVESTARMVEAQASVTASSIYGESYASVAAVHSDRVSVERMLHEYSEGITELRRLINQ